MVLTSARSGAEMFQQRSVPTPRPVRSPFT